MQRLINAIDKAAKAGVYNLQETAEILKSIEEVGKVVYAYNKNENEKAEAAKAKAVIDAGTKKKPLKKA